MASTTEYSMNQFRYNGDVTGCMVEQEITPLYLDWRIDDESAPFYRDVVIDVKNKMNSGDSYYLSFGVPRDLNYNFNVSVKLLNNDKNFQDFIYSNTKTTYQFIKYIPIYKSATDGSRNSLVCLYKVPDHSTNVLPSGDSSEYTHVDENLGPKVARQSLQKENYQINPAYDAPTLESGIFYEVAYPYGVFEGSSIQEYIFYPGYLYHEKIRDI